MRTSVASRVLDAAGQEELSRREATECSHDVTTASTGSGRRVWRVDDLPRGGDPSPPGRRAAMPVDGARPWRLRAAAHLWSVRPMRPARPRRTLLQYAGVRGLEPARCSSRTRLSARRERPPAHAAGSRGRAPGRRAVQRAVLPPRLSAGAARADGLTSPSRRDPAHLDAELSGREEAFGLTQATSSKTAARLRVTSARSVRTSPGRRSGKVTEKSIGTAADGGASRPPPMSALHPASRTEAASAGDRRDNPSGRPLCRARLPPRTRGQPDGADSPRITLLELSTSQPLARERLARGRLWRTHE